MHPVRFHFRGEVVSLPHVPPTRTVLDWLREDARRTGTKEGCNEGDCGACTVVIGELPEHADAAATLVRGLALKSVNACLQFVPALHGKALFTVEDLQAIAGGALHPVQRALVDAHASQCGFCTPGFAMSLWLAYERQQATGTAPTRAGLADALSGNLCRCTGYRPILDAGERMAALPPAPLDTAPVLAALRAIAVDTPAVRVHGTGDGAPAFHAPADVDALAGTLQAHPQARLLAGGTDVALRVTKQLRDLGDVVYLGDVAALKRIETRADGTLSIGGGASLEAAWAALAARAPALAEMGLRFASPPIRHAGTLGGNLANGSPIGDGAPVLMALDAVLVLRRGARERRLPLDGFYVDYMRNALEPGEFVQAIEVPPAAFARTLRACKVAKRHDSDISGVAAGLAVALDGDGRVHEVRLAFGGLAATVRRAAQAEAALAGAPWTEPAVRAAQAALARDFTPISDLRASAGYRAQVAQNLLWRFWLETRVDDPLPASATSVRACAAATP